MKKIAIMLSFFFLIVINTQAQEIIENPEKPLSKTAGRVRNLLRFPHSDIDQLWNPVSQQHVDLPGLVLSG